MKISVVLNKDRSKPGRLTVDGSGVSISCLGKSDNMAAIKALNPTRNPVYQFGDTPTGLYSAMVVAAKPNTFDNRRKFGPHQRILLDAVDGQALEAESKGKRSGLMIHGGAPNRSGGLRPTHGCIRVSDTGMGELLDALKSKSGPLICEVTEA